MHRHAPGPEHASEQRHPYDGEEAEPRGKQERAPFPAHELPIADHQRGHRCADRIDAVGRDRRHAREEREDPKHGDHPISAGVPQRPDHHGSRKQQDEEHAQDDVALSLRAADAAKVRTRAVPGRPQAKHSAPAGWAASCTLHAAGTPGTWRLSRPNGDGRCYTVDERGSPLGCSPR